MSRRKTEAIFEIYCPVNNNFSPTVYTRNHFLKSKYYDVIVSILETKTIRYPRGLIRDNYYTKLRIWCDEANIDLFKSIEDLSDELFKLKIYNIVSVNYTI